jgi:hypothetical protein
MISLPNARMIVLALLAVGSDPVLALAPMARPTPFAAISPGDSAPYAGAWAVTIPTREVGVPETVLAQCALPVRIEPADDRHIFYLGPNETVADAAIELIAEGDGTGWEPIAGGPAFLAVWVTADSFYLYDAVAEGEPDWTAPYVYTRCP